MPSSLPDGISVRPLTRDDAELVAEVINEDEQWLGRTPRRTAADVLAWWIRTDLTEGSWLLEEGSRPIALGWLEVHDGVAFCAGGVSSVAKGRGFGARLVEQAELRARELGAARILQHTFGEDASARALLESRGYHEARRHYEMAIELVAPPPDPGELPDGLILDTFRREDAQEFHDAIMEAFAHEWGWAPMPFDDWWEMRKNDEHNLWFVAREGDRIAAAVRCEARTPDAGLVGMLGVRPLYRRRGLGRALLAHAFGELWQRGIRRVTLGVDSQNPTGATRLYEQAGMHVESEDVTFEKELA